MKAIWKSEIGGSSVGNKTLGEPNSGSGAVPKERMTYE